MSDLPSHIYRRHGVPPLWTSERLYFSGDEYFNDILADIENAQELITVEMYIFEDDAMGERFFRAFEVAAKRNVKILLMFDGVGSHKFIQKLQEHEYNQNIKIKVYNPHPWSFSNERFQDFFLMIKIFMKRLLGVNRRNHRKVITIDERVVYSGSFNITISHSKEFLKEKAWNDIGIRMQGWIAPLMVLSLMKNWGITAFFRYRKKMPKKKFIRFNHPDIRLNQDFRLRRTLYKDFLKRLKKSQQRIWLSTGYFQPKRRIIRLLKGAAQRGVDVRVLLSSKNDIFYYGLLQTYYHFELVRAGVKVYEFDPTLIHAKNYFIDDWVSVGSTNLNYRSFMHDLEADFIVQHPENKTRLNKNFEDQQAASREITLETLQNRKWYVKLACRFIFFFKYWN